MSTMTMVVLYAKSAINRLESALHSCSLPSFDRWTNVVELCLFKMIITEKVLNLMCQFLDQPFAKDPTGSSDEERRWIHVKIIESRFPHVKYDINDLEKHDFVSIDDVPQLFSAIADRALRLDIISSPEFLTDFLSTHYTPRLEQLMVDTLHIEQIQRLSIDEYERLGTIIASSVALRGLHLHLPLSDGAHLLFEGLANAINIQALSLHDFYYSRNSQSEFLIAGNGPLIQLLQNPQNQLKKLNLSKLGLHDQHLIAISQLLPTCQIEEFDVYGNLIESHGISEFVHQLPRMHSLKHVRFGSNPWLKSEIACNTIGAALLQYIMENTSIESMDTLNVIPQGPLILHYVVLNRAGRRFLVSSKPIPDGLWPLILERAGDVERYTGEKMCGNYRIDVEQTARCDAVYYVCKVVVHSFLSSPSNASKRQFEVRETIAWKHPRLVPNDEQSLHSDVTPEKEQVPRWGQNIEQQVAEINGSLRAIDQRSQRALNRGLKRNSEKLEPVIHSEDGTVPPIFPVTLEELLLSDEDRIDELLRFYGLPDNGTINDKKESLKNFLGVNL